MLIFTLGLLVSVAFSVGAWYSTLQWSNRVLKPDTTKQLSSTKVPATATRVRKQEANEQFKYTVPPRVRGRVYPQVYVTPEGIHPLRSDVNPNTSLVTAVVLNQPSHGVVEVLPMHPYPHDAIYPSHSYSHVSDPAPSYSSPDPTPSYSSPDPSPSYSSPDPAPSCDTSTQSCPDVSSSFDSGSFGGGGSSDF